MLLLLPRKSRQAQGLLCIQEAQSQKWACPACAAKGSAALELAQAGQARRSRRLKVTEIAQPPSADAAVPPGAPADPTASAAEPAAQVREYIGRQGKSVSGQKAWRKLGWAACW